MAYSKVGLRVVFRVMNSDSASDTVEAALRSPTELRAGRLLALKESQWYERKSSRIQPKALAQSLVAMANADGGTLVVGLHDGKVDGVENIGPRLNDLQQASRDFCQPRVHATSKIVDCIFELQRRQLLVFGIQPSEHLHQTTDGATYIRVGDEKRKLSATETVELQYDKSQGSFETARVPEATIDDIDVDRLSSYAARLDHPKPMRLLRDRTLSTPGQITVAGCLLFSFSPTAFLPSALVRITRWAGRTRETGRRQNVVSDQRIEGPIPATIEQSRKVILELQPKRRALEAGGTFGDVPTVPEEAWLEGLVNAVLHRSYSLEGDHIHVDLFDDRIEITSPGPFPHLVDLTDLLNARRYARNPRIVRVCSDLDLCQEQGEGIRRIHDEMRLAGLDAPLYHQTRMAVTLTLSAEPKNREIDARYRDDVATILSALRSTERLSTSEIADRIGRSNPAARNLLRKMRDASLIEWRGKSQRDPRAYWCLADSPSGNRHTGIRQ